MLGQAPRGCVGAGRAERQLGPEVARAAAAAEVAGVGERVARLPGNCGRGQPSGWARGAHSARFSGAGAERRL